MPTSIGDKFVTKNLVFKEESGERFFEGILTVEMLDRQGEVTMVDSLYKCLPIWMDRGGAISDTHSNRIVGKGINYSKTTLTDEEGNILPAIKIIGKIFNHTELDNDIWEKIKSREYKGLSFGGATTSDAIPVTQSDGSIAFHLKDIEMYEIAVCEEPAVPFALITEFNQIAKSDDVYKVEEEETDVLIRCEEKGCFVSRNKSLEDVKKPLNTRWGKMEFDQCEARARNTDDIKDPEGYCGSIQNRTENKGEENKDMYDGRVGVNPIEDKDLEEIETAKGKLEAQSEGLTKPKDDKDIKELHIAKECTCKESSPSITDGSRMLGAGNTAQQGSNETAQITEEKKDDEIKPESLGDPQKLKKPGDVLTDRAPSIKNEIYINQDKVKSDNNMTIEEITKEDKVEAPEEEQKPVEEKKTDDESDKKEEAIKSFEATLKTVADSVKTVSDVVKSIDERVKALETPTDLPVKPKESDKEDIGAEVKTPDTYQSNSVQAGLHDDKTGEKKPEGDKNGLQMQEKSIEADYAFTSETPRPSATVTKAAGSQQTALNPVLKAARSRGNQYMDTLAREILSGKYGNEEEVFY